MRTGKGVVVCIVELVSVLTPPTDDYIGPLLVANRFNSYVRLKGARLKGATVYTLHIPLLKLP